MTDLGRQEREAERNAYAITRSAYPEMTVPQLEALNIGHHAGYQAALAAREEPQHAKTHEYEMPERVVRVLDLIMSSKDVDPTARAFHEAYEKLAPEWGYKTRPESAVPWEQVPAANKGLMCSVIHQLIEDGVLAAREDTERPEEVERLREGLERALDVSFIVGLLRARAGKTADPELAEWGERLKAQLVAIREVLSPGTAVAMAELRDTEQEPNAIERTITEGLLFLPSLDANVLELRAAIESIAKALVDRGLAREDAERPSTPRPSKQRVEIAARALYDFVCKRDHEAFEEGLNGEEWHDPPPFENAYVTTEYFEKARVVLCAVRDTEQEPEVSS